MTTRHWICWQLMTEFRFLWRSLLFWKLETCFSVVALVVVDVAVAVAVAVAVVAVAVVAVAVVFVVVAAAEEMECQTFSLFREKYR